MGEEVAGTKPIPSAADPPPPSPAAAAPLHFVLVHGIGGGSWCWYKLRCLMENSGHRVSCVDLKSAGIDPSAADSVLCLDDYNKPLVDLVSSLRENDRVVLVGHSAGGLSVTDASYRLGKKKIKLTAESIDEW